MLSGSVEPEHKGKHTTRTFHDRLHTVGWGLFLILIGIVWILPENVMREGTFFLGVGVILLGINAIKFLKGIKADSAGIFFGILFLVLGLRDVLEIKFSLFPVILIVLGVMLIVFEFSKKRHG